MSKPETSKPSLEKRLAEAARYALVRRLAPAIRHNMAGALQPVSMIAAMLERRVQSATPDMAQLGKNSRDIGLLSREAAGSCMDLMGWIAPKDNDLVALHAAVEEAVGLVATELSFKGFGLANETADTTAELPRAVVRSVFLAGLLALTDAAPAPASVRISSHTPADGAVTLTLELSPTDGEASSNNAPAYRLIDWDDVQALARAEGVALAVADHRLQLSWRRASA